MKFRFRRNDELIVVQVVIVGPKRKVRLRMALDTEALTTMLSVSSLIAAGYDPTVSMEMVELTTASTVEVAPVVILENFRALGQDRSDFPVLGHSLPSGAGVDGLLGLDFLRGLSLTIDFRSGSITLD